MRTDRWLDVFLERRFVADKIFDVTLALVVLVLSATMGKDIADLWQQTQAPVSLPEKPAPSPPVEVKPEEPEPQRAGESPKTDRAPEVVEGPLVRGGDGQNLGSSFHGTCVDQDGREGGFRAVMFLHQYTWGFGSEDVVLGESPDQDLSRVLREDGLREALGTARELIAVGTASCEGEELEEEEKLARSRAQKLIAMARSAIPPPATAPSLNAYWLNLGQFDAHQSDVACDGTASEETAFQRRLLLIAVDREDDQLDLHSCLRGVFESHPQLEFLTNYSRFDVSW